MSNSFVTSAQSQQPSFPVAPWIALAGLLGAGMLTTLWQDHRRMIAGHLVEVVKQNWHAGMPMGLAQAVFAALALLAVVAASVPFLLAVFLLVETILVGRAGEGRRLRLHGVIWLLHLLLLYGAGLIFTQVIRTSILPLVTISKADLPDWLGGFRSALLLIALLLCFDFVGYCTHRLQHGVPLFWRFHSVHHSIEELDSLASFSHPLDAVVPRLGLGLLALLVGFTFDTVIVLHAFLAIHGSLIHTRAPVNLGPLGGWLVDNRYHFLHHTRAEAQSGINFGGLTTIWDRVFGTYRRPLPGRLPQTGLDDQRHPGSLRQFLLAPFASRRSEANAVTLP